MENSASDREPSQEALHPPLSSPTFLLVGLGASAGGIRALQTFFEGLPDESGMAFVVIMHLSPDYESNLAHILQRHTSMPVLQVTEPVSVAPNHVYVIPPSKHLSLQDSRIELVEPQQPTGKRLAIDLFFRTLSAAYGSRAVAIVLSGTDSDGAIGVKYVKEQGGLTIAQEPTEAEFDSMPRSAIATGMVDWVLPTAQMPLQLMELLRNEARMHIPPEETQSEEDARAEDGNSGGPVPIRKVPSASDEEALIEVLRFLRIQTGHDFSHYKRATILRRVARRLQVNLLEDIPTYLAFLRLHPGETAALLHDLLISVTNFFRDAEAFVALESQIPQLFADKSANDQVRVWVAGCATGEEAYSIAMLLTEYIERLDAPPMIQVFATDLDEDAIQIARTGVYPATIEADVSAERLRRFFYKEEGRYRIRKDLRERALFSVHNLLKDSPFSRLDLVTCRNLLIYLKRDAQEAVFGLFHFALRPSGLLFLGSAESLTDTHPLFAPLEKRHRLFVRRAALRAGWQIPALPVSSVFAAPASSLPIAPPLVSILPSESASATLPETGSFESERRPPIGDLHLSLLEQFAPPSVVVNRQYDIVHLSERASRYLQIAGEPSLNLLQVVHPALRLELRSALFRAAHQGINVTTAPILFDNQGDPRLITLHVRPARAGTTEDGYLLVVFEPTDVVASSPQQTPAAPDAMMRHLEDEIQHLREQLNATVEQYEASLEELKASNEEHQSINEEMRSATEELETSKEELQSTNEELTTVNQELKSNLDELSRANGDLQNLMAATEIGTIFLDRQLRIKRFTPRIRELFNVIPTDIGRPLSDITHKLNYQHFMEDAGKALDDLARSEREVHNKGQYYLARLLPYRTLDDRIDGVVLTFIDITERKKAEEALRASEERLRVIVENLPGGATFLVDRELRYLLAEGRALAVAGFRSEDLVGKTVYEALNPESAVSVAEAFEKVLAGESFTQEHLVNGRTFMSHGVPLRSSESEVYAAFIVSYDISERKRAEEALRESEEKFRILSDTAPALIWFDDQEGRCVSVNQSYLDFAGKTMEELKGEGWHLILHEEDAEGYLNAFQEATRERKPFHHLVRAKRQDGEWRWLETFAQPLFASDGAFLGHVGISPDITERVRVEDALRESEDWLQRAVQIARVVVWDWRPGDDQINTTANFRDIYGLTSLEAAEQGWEMVHPDDRPTHVEKVQRTATEGGGYHSEFRIIRPDTQEIVWIEEYATALLDEQGRVARLVGAALDITERKTAEARRLTLERETTLLAERNRMAQDLHDTLAQGFTAIKLQADAAEMKLPEDPTAAQAHIVRAREIAQESLLEARRSIKALRSPSLEVNDLSAALRRLAEQADDGVHVEFIPQGDAFALPPEVANALYRIGQEALTNALRHAQPSQVSIELAYLPDAVRLRVRDDGRGFDTTARHPGFGLVGMQERALQIDAELLIESESGRGTVVIVTFARSTASD